MIEITQPEFHTLINYIKGNYGIDLIKKKNLIEGRLSNVIVDKGFNSFGEYLKSIHEDKSGSEAIFLIDKLTTNHTYFMRESMHYEYLENNFLPYAKENIKDKDLRIWSAGCSSGEEAYTTAMIIQEFFGSEIGKWDTKILATDISASSLKAGKEGIYSELDVKKLPEKWRWKYFKQISPTQYALDQKIKNEVIFRSFNLMNKTFPFKKKFHLIFCRNVMIYFDRDTKNELIEKFYEHTEHGGYLFIGHSESIPKHETRYKYIMPAVYRKV
jgi:chemotaxis protein methyltransferase CheR